MSTSMTPEQIRSAIADHLRTELAGKVSDDVVNNAVQRLSADTQSYPATGSVASMVFYLRWQITIDGGKTFDGSAGGLSTPGGGALFGTVYTDDISKLYSETVSFEYNAVAAYTSILFFDGSSNLLGHFQSGSVSTVIGIGGGKGSWS